MYRDQLYFERAHGFAPIIHKHRYLGWSRLAHKTAGQTALQYAMWALASSLSTQMQHMHSFFYDNANRLLDDLETKDLGLGFGEVENIQARVLLPIYDFMRTNDQRGWLSAGRCFRLIQLQRMYEIDAPDLSAMNTAPNVETWSKQEELRRTFWMAYCLDRFISIRKEWPLTLNEHSILTRLPAPEEEFQHDQWVDMGFLSDAITSDEDKNFSPFTHSIILATVCGRAVAHKQQSGVEHVYMHNPEDFWGRHDWLEHTLVTRTARLSASTQSMTDRGDCMVTFNRMVAQTTMLYLCKVMDSLCWDTDEYNDKINHVKTSSWKAAHEIVVLSRSLGNLSNFKVGLRKIDFECHR